jgi:segregation and condensation protein B
MAMSADELRSTIEAILFVSGEPVSLDRLAEAFPDEGRESIAAEVERIRKHFEENVGGFGLEETGGGYRFASRPGHEPFLRKFFSKQGEGRLSLAALETLAIIAYRQPMTAPEISDIRGVNTSGVLRTLLDRRMIRIAGRKAVVGSPFLYRTTREFLMHFGLNTLQDLPRLEEFGDLLGDNVAEVFLSEAQEAEDGSGAAVEETPLQGEQQNEDGTDSDGELVETDAAGVQETAEDGELESAETNVDVEDADQQIENEFDGEIVEADDSFDESPVSIEIDSSEELTVETDPAETDRPEESEEEGSETERKTVEFPGNDND